MKPLELSLGSSVAEDGRSEPNSAVKLMFMGPCIVSIFQQDATLHSLFTSESNSTYFGWYLHPSSEEHTIVSTASGICQTNLPDKYQMLYIQLYALLMMGGGRAASRYK
jgi:hypothetical protein